MLGVYIFIWQTFRLTRFCGLGSIEADRLHTQDAFTLSLDEKEKLKHFDRQLKNV
jgi:hypothetical protein